MAAGKYIRSQVPDRSSKLHNHLQARGFKLTTFSDANWGMNPVNGKSNSFCLAFLSNGLVSFKVRLQGLTARSTVEAELMTAVMATNEAVFYSNMVGIRHAL